MGDLSSNYSRHEWVCKCGCGFDTVDAELVKVLQKNVSNHFKRRVLITPNGGCRCYMNNIECDGANRSQHTQGKAADIKVDGISPEEVYDHLNKTFPNKYGLGLYKSFTHVDVRPEKARWGKKR